MLSPLAGVLRLASFVLCLIVIVSCALFAIDKTSSASAHQQAVVNNETAATQMPPGQRSASSPDAGKSTARKTLDEAAEAVTSPFSFATEATSSEWLAHGIDLALTLLVYGFGLAFLARMIRVRL